MRRVASQGWLRIAGGMALAALTLSLLFSAASRALAAPEKSVYALTTANELLSFNDDR
ncbi:MAG: hypothetical protein H7Y32_03500, partial [Chloroflexales bacterium]|nr:hypothetical protein [Chloroflexales bacterium]